MYMYINNNDTTVSTNYWPLQWDSEDFVILNNPCDNIYPYFFSYRQFKKKIDSEENLFRNNTHWKYYFTVKLY